MIYLDDSYLTNNPEELVRRECAECGAHGFDEEMMFDDELDLYFCNDAHQEIYINNMPDRLSAKTEENQGNGEKTVDYLADDSQIKEGEV